MTSKGRSTILSRGTIYSGRILLTKLLSAFPLHRLDLIAFLILLKILKKYSSSAAITQFTILKFHLDRAKAHRRQYLTITFPCVDHDAKQLQKYSTDKKKPIHHKRYIFRLSPKSPANQIGNNDKIMPSMFISTACYLTSQIRSIQSHGSSQSPIYYSPHYTVLRNYSAIKLRIIFNKPSLTSSGSSFSNILHTDDLRGILWVDKNSNIVPSRLLAEVVYETKSATSLGEVVDQNSLLRLFNSLTFA
ncbi:hypothetical protein V1477_002161 [Vespula maculifrons]|uniref:Uncharacterized protein n=1 Tax=Vespula maculifrons TaxID=7453 RepID=A0ABD2CW37_VESMC